MILTSIGFGIAQSPVHCKTVGPTLPGRPAIKDCLGSVAVSRPNQRALVGAHVALGGRGTTKPQPTNPTSSVRGRARVARRDMVSSQ